MFCIWVVSWKDWKNTITIPIFDQRSSIVYAILLMPNLIFNLEWTLGICVGPSPISSFWVLALVRYISTFGNLGIWWDFKNVGSSPIYTSVGPRTDPHIGSLTNSWSITFSSNFLSLTFRKSKSRQYFRKKNASKILTLKRWN